MTTRKLKSWMIVAVTIISGTVNGQTSVSGGIFANTTWTKVNSPYIVTDTVVVFPGYTLTIEPGVEVRFDDDVMLELRQATLIANGTSADSITFTSNALTPVPGSWIGIWFDGGNISPAFNYCKVQYAHNGLRKYSSPVIIITHSVFSHNQTGCEVTNAIIDSCNFINNNMHGLSISSTTVVTNCNFSGNEKGVSCSVWSGDTLINCNFNNNIVGIYPFGNGGTNPLVVENCIIRNNMIGVSGDDFYDDHMMDIKNSIIDSNSAIGIRIFDNYLVTNCVITHNGIGLTDSAYNLQGANYRIRQNRIENNVIGIKLRHAWNSIIKCNRICNNASYDFYWTFSGAIDISDNYWCTTDSAAIAAKIYDGYDNINFGLVTFLPLDTSQCYIATVSISGVIVTETGIPVQGVTITLSGDDVQTATTNSNGRYNFTVAQGGNYTVSPSKNNDVVTNNGITAIDILLMRAHILNILPLGSPYKIIAAAEVNASGDTTITTQDILFTRSLILGTISSFPTNRLWQFVSSDYVFLDNNHPFPFPASHTYANVTTNQTNQNFIGIKLGDVNDSWNSGIP